MIKKKAGELNTRVSEKNISVLNFHTLHNFQTKSDSESGKMLYIGIFDAKGVVDIENDANVRGFLKLDKFGEEKVNTGVHSKIYETLNNRPEDFHLLNGGITICAESLYARDNDRKKISLKNASIINGAQTRGVIKKFLSENPDIEDLLVKVEIIFSQDREFFDDVSIARNQQSAVKALSISGKKGLIDELDKVTEVALKLDESQKDKFDTEKLVQLIFATMPKDVWTDVFPKRKHWDKSVVYSSKATMFKKFNELSEFSRGSLSYKFFIDVADDVIKLYQYIQSNKPVITKFMDVGNFKKQGYRINPTTKEVTVLDGFIFPMMSLASQFVQEFEGKFKLPLLSDEILKSFAKLIAEYSGVNDHGNVQTLGKKSVSYKAPYDFAESKKQLGNLETYFQE